MENDMFFEKISGFITCAQNIDDVNTIKLQYLKLVREFHPDTNNVINKEILNEYMIIINYVYEQLINKNENIKLNFADEYDKNKINGKYCLINEFGRKECITDKILYIYKLGRLEYSKAYMIMHENPAYMGNKEKSGYEITGHLYKSYKYFKDVIKLDKNGNWGREAKINLHYAYEMNEHITRGLQTTNGKEIIIG
jgi:hypothetical protein